MDLSAKEIRSSENEGIIRGTFILTLSALILKVLGLIYKIPLSSILGDEGMGYFNSAYTVYTFVYLICTAGVPKAVTMLVAEAKARGNLAKKGIVRCALSAFFLIGFIITAVFMILSPQISSLIGNKEAYSTMLVVAPSIIFSSMSGVLRGYLTAEMKLGSVAISQLIEGGARLAFGLIFAIRAQQLEYTPAMISAFTILGVTLGSAFSCIHLYVCKQISEKKDKSKQSIDLTNRKDILKRLFSISVPITLSAAVMSISNLIDLVTIMRRLSALGYSAAEGVALYGNYTTLAVPMFNLIIALITPISVAFFPVFSRCEAESDSLSSRNALSSSLILSAFVSAPCVIGSILFSEQILSLIFPSSNIEVGAPLLCLLMPAALVMSLLLITNSMLEAKGSVKTPLLSMLIGGFIKFIVGGILMSNPDFGISAAPLGTVAGYSTSLLISIIVLYKKHKLSVPILSTHIVPYLNAFISVGIAKWLHYYKLLNSTNATPTLISILTAALIYITLSALCGLMGKRKLQILAKYTKF